MTDNLEEMLEAAARVQISERESFEQRQSFAYGNAKIENELVTREMIAKAAARSQGK